MKVNNDYIQITDDSGGTSVSEVRQIKDEVGTSNTFRLDKPLRFDHPNGSQIHEVSGGASPSGTFTHTITETFDLDTNGDIMPEVYPSASGHFQIDSNGDIMPEDV